MPPELMPGIFFSDSVIREENTGKLSLIGGFQFFNATAFPFQGTPFVVTVALKGLPDDHPFKIKVEVIASNSVGLGHAEGQILIKKIESPDVSFEFPFALPALTFPTPGTYTIIVSVDDIVIGRRPLYVRSVTSMN